MLVAGVLAAGALRAQTIVTEKQLAITAGTTTLDSGWIFTGGDLADGDAYKPTIAGTSSLHRDALFVRGGATLALVSGANVAVKNDANLTTFLRVGYGDDETGTLTIANGATLAVGQSTRYANFQVAEGQRARGFVQQSGGAVTVKGSFNVGVNGGDGTYTLSGGTLTLDHADDAGHTSLNTIGYNGLGASSAASSGTFNLTGGTLNVTAHLWDPAGHPGEYGGTRLILGNRTTAGGAGDGTLTQSGGVLHVDNAAGFYLSAVGSGVYNLNGGTLEVGGDSLHAKYNSGAGTYAFNYGGGTIKVIGSALTTDVNLTLQPTANGTASVIDTNGFDATLSGNVTTTGTGQTGAGGNGWFKLGTGTLNFTGASRGLNTFGVMGGTAVQSTGATTATEFMIGTGAGYTGAFVLNGGSLTIDQTLNPNGTLKSSGSLRVGDYGGTGTFTQNAGTVTVNAAGALNLGNQGGTGTYNLAGGSLVLQDGLNILGRSQSGQAASQGTLNVSGGTLTLQTNSSLILGNNFTGTGVALGTGTVNQTGGTVHVAGDSWLYLSGYGNGTYNLKGGTLEIGGSSLVDRYNNTTSTYAFNFGSTAALSQLKVVGSNLMTSASLTLQPTSVLTPAVLDTNGYEATLSGNITTAGTGQEGVGGNGFRKTGAGTLNLTGGSRAFNTFGVMGGTVAQSTGATTATEFMVGTAEGYSGAYVLNGGSITIDPTLDGSGHVVTVGSLRTGDFGGTGTFTQNAGTVTVSDGAAFHVGNQGGTGIYNLAGGTLSLIGNINVLGRSTGSNAAGTGTLNVSGGLLQLQGASGRLILGNNAGGVATGTGTINQTGGTVSIANESYLYFAGYGSGTYNLTGGTLEAGGSSLQTRYSTSTAAYAFNLGGGTLKVVGTDLSAPFDATLSAATTSTLNTNGRNATWTGKLSGAGGLTKTGTGVLTLANAANSYSGATTVSGGTLSVTGSLLNSAVIVGSGGALRGSGGAAGVTIQSGGLFEPGSGVGAFTVNGDLTLAAGSTTSLEIDSLARGSGYDYITATSTFSFGGTFNLSLNPGLSLVAGNSFDLFDWGNQSGAFAVLHLPSLDSALAWDTSQLYTTGVLGVTTATAVPEPATVALFAGLGALGLACWRRRSR